MTAAYRVMAAREQPPLGAPPFHSWTFPDGRIWAEFHRKRGEVIIRFPGLADFRLPGDGGAPACWPAPGLTDDTREHLFINQVLPLLQGRSGLLVLHASAVAIEGRAVAFVGRSGCGKSTLATAFGAGGFPFLADDGLVVTERDGICMAQPSHPSIRLWNDSREALVPPEAACAGPVSYTDKARLLAGAGLPHFESPLPLGAVCFLGQDEVGDTRIRRLSGGGLLSECVQHSFLLEPDDPEVLERHFSTVASFTNAVPCYRLDFPRRYDSLPAVRHAIVAHVNGERSP
jgi:hypothetical protein